MALKSNLIYICYVTLQYSVKYKARAIINIIIN